MLLWLPSHRTISQYLTSTLISTISLDEFWLIVSPHWWGALSSERRAQVCLIQPSNVKLARAVVTFFPFPAMRGKQSILAARSLALQPTLLVGTIAGQRESTWQNTVDRGVGSTSICHLHKSPAAWYSWFRSPHLLAGPKSCLEIIVFLNIWCIRYHVTYLTAPGLIWHGLGKLEVHFNLWGILRHWTVSYVHIS